ncbi:acyltransferase domain-containing protein [Streptomyces thermogriseus]
MGRELLAGSEVFAAAVDACDAALRPFTGWSVRQVLAGGGGDHPPLERVDVVQPALFAMGVGLAAVWRSLGVEPAAVVGHSQGEVAAAVVCGALSLEQGAQVVAQRSQAVLACSGRGGMALVELPPAVVEEHLASFGSALSVAAVNTASSTVVSGQAEAVAELVERLQEQGVYARRINVDYASHHAQMDPLLPELAARFAGLAPARARVPLYSTVTGEVLEGPELDGGYWCRNLREPVRFDRALQRLLEDGHSVFVEVSAHPVLAMPLTDACSTRGGVVVGSLARDRGGRAQLLRNAGLLHVHGHQLDWDRLLPQGGRLAELPTYPFQRERYWLEVARPAGDVRALGLRASEHPWLGAVTATASDEGYLFTGRLSLADQPWLAEHAVFGTVLVPGTGLLELALTAAHHVGADRVAELTLLEPLVLTEDTPVRLQVVVGAETGENRRPIAIYSRPEDAAEDAPWRRHATGELGRAEPIAGEAFAELARWPVAGAEQVELDGFYEAFAARGLDYGPAFQGLVELWRKDNTAYGRVRLPEGLTTDGFGIHPALLDAALHTLVSVQEDENTLDGNVLLPFEWTGAELLAVGAAELRVRVDLDEASRTVRVVVTDQDGRPVARAEGLQLREVTAEQVRVGGAGEHLYRVVFQPVRDAQRSSSGGVWVLGGSGEVARALEAESFAGLEELLARLDVAEAGVPGWVVVDATCPAADGDALAVTGEALEVAQRLLADERLASAELVWVTRGGVAAVEGDRLEGLSCAPLWGLVRAARSEHPERGLRLIDLGPEDADWEGLAAAVAVAGEPELAVRGGEVLAARLMRAGATGTTDTTSTGNSTSDHSDSGGAVRALDPEGTVLITGGTGELGRVVARHLVAVHGVRHLVLTSRRGPDAPGTAELIHELEEEGAECVRVVACDVADRGQVEALLAGVDAAHPWTGVFHLAAVLDDGLLVSQSGERLAGVWGAKAAGACHLDELTRELDLAAFVLFSSAAGVFGGAGQSNYAAANAFWMRWLFVVGLGGCRRSVCRGVCGSRRVWV